MIATPLLPPAMLRFTSLALAMLKKVLMVSGLVLIIALFGLHYGHSAVVDGLKSVLPHVGQSSDEALAGAVGALPAPLEAVVDAPVEALSPRMRGALEYVARRYRVSVDALQPIFATAQAAGRELSLDPLLIVAVIGVESGFNPLSQSVVGAQGLMQVIPHYHRDKLPDDAGNLPFFDPQTNVQVGARVLKESISRNGGVEDGLQQFGGALNDPDRRYSGRVLAERQRLEQAAQRLRAT